MMSYVLPPLGNKALCFSHFPTKMQAFIFRNWNTVKKEKLAEVLETTVENVVCEAVRMGLPPQEDVSLWREKGYITIIRANWHLLDYTQLCELLDEAPEKLAEVLKEEDFLDIKLGCFKPECEKVLYRPLTETEIKETEKLRSVVKKYISPHKRELSPFDFFADREAARKENDTSDGGGVRIDSLWFISDKTGDKTVAEMVCRFIKSFEKTWGISLAKSEQSLYPIELSFIPCTEEEYHEIEITADKITVKAGQSAGVLRALYRLEALMEARGAAVLSSALYKRKPRFKIRYIYPYCGLYHKSLEVPSEMWCPDALLEKYARSGVNGIWLHVVLYQLSVFEYEPSISDGYEKRRKYLREFIERAKLYGMKVYLYINEPRKMPLSFFEKYPDMKGTVEGGYACLCTQTEKVRHYIKSAISSLCRACPGLGGIFTITMSENTTHCKARRTDGPMCERCRDIPAWKLAADVNTMIFEAARSVDENFSVITWDWGWNPLLDFEPEGVECCIKEMPEGISVMCNCDREIPFERGGIKNLVHDYSLSVPGISEKALATWKLAKSRGQTTTAKLQINNTWEGATVPYLPVFERVRQLVQGMADSGVDNLMLSWSLGGYPSVNIRLISEFFFEENGNSTSDFDLSMKIAFGEDAAAVKRAGELFTEAFSEFPFDIHTAYFGPQNSGVSNLLYAEPTGYEATMTCFPYDDVEKWRAVYPRDIFENQFRLVSEKWEDGLRLLDGVGGEISDVAYVSYTLFKSTYNQIKFVRLRDDAEANREELLAILDDERNMAERVYEIMMRLPEIGFEAANQYYFDSAAIAEKIINCEHLAERYKK